MKARILIETESFKDFLHAHQLRGHVFSPADDCCVFCGIHAEDDAVTNQHCPEATRVNDPTAPEFHYDEDAAGPVREAVTEAESFQQFLRASRPVEPKYVYCRGGGERGELTGVQRRCAMAGCIGRAIGVRWPDGKVTWNCSKNLTLRDDGQYELN